MFHPFTLAASNRVHVTEPFCCGYGAISRSQTVPKAARTGCQSVSACAQGTPDVKRNGHGQGMTPRPSRRECPEIGGMPIGSVRPVGSVTGWRNSDAVGAAVG